MKTLLKCALFAIVMGLLLYGFDAWATGTEGPFKRAANIMIVTFKNVRMIVYILGAFGLIGIAVGAIMGKINFKWLAVLAIGLAIVAGADAIIKYATMNNQHTTVDSDATTYGDAEFFK